MDHLLTAHLMKANEELRLAAQQAQDIAEAALKELDALEQSSKRDPLTGLPDRTLFLDRLETAIAMARRRGSRIAVLFVDLDNFKQINDQWGHRAGDEALKLAALRLSSVVRSSDSVSRHGGDEFLLLLAEVTRPSDAELISAKILASFAEPCSVDGHVLELSASIGISVYPEYGQDAAVSSVGQMLRCITPNAPDPGATRCTVRISPVKMRLISRRRARWCAIFERRCCLFRQRRICSSAHGTILLWSRDCRL